MSRRWATIQIPLEAKEEIASLVGDTRRPVHSFLVEAMRIREYLKEKGKLEQILQILQVDCDSTDA